MATFLTLGMPKPEGHRPLLAGLLVEAGELPVELSADVGPSEAADALAFLVHSGRGFAACADDGTGVLRVLAATVAALRGDDVRAAWSVPDPAWVALVPDPAAEALREVLVHVVVPDVARVAAELAELGLT
ncbi:hypothetical protein RHODO2019_15870 [Rhodococcus antarcticus]|uniref:Uncharacterized protein n=1 Tax=Rhodococcus antarcticus TaxID=2987751 RepID=A0ABY6NYW6_9NOCA|nr:hypothetical protein [Rhodococcus antarcticus]UZJ24582.1 hypothetical protein RHODO2019_15870 [Rhodococcus antarcticus]